MIPHLIYLGYAHKQKGLSISNESHGFFHRNFS
uniref:Uncharacterized protein n=1 Tax=Anguilla anguilla TaxID=7936 RepID=A0A0E9T0G2_ANGAN